MIFVLIEFSLTFPVLNDFLPNLPGCLIASGFALSASTLIMGYLSESDFFFFFWIRCSQPSSRLSMDLDKS